MARIKIVQFSALEDHLQLEKARDELEQASDAVKTHQRHLCSAELRRREAIAEYQARKAKIGDYGELK